MCFSSGHSGSVSTQELPTRICERFHIFRRRLLYYDLVLLKAPTIVFPHILIYQDTMLNGCLNTVKCLSTPLLCIFDNQTKLPQWLTLQMSIPISHLLTMIFYPFSIVHCVLAYVSCVVCGCVSRQFQQAEGLSMGSLEIFDVAKISRNFVDSSGHTPQYVGCVIFLNSANCFVPGPPQPQHIWTPVCRVLGSRPAQPAATHRRMLQKWNLTKTWKWPNVFHPAHYSSAHLQIAI